jgi:hypothetical protein
VHFFPGDCIPLLQFMRLLETRKLKEMDELDLERSSDHRLNRGEFVKKLVRQATVAGTLTIAPAIVEQFIAPPAVAAASGGGGSLT